MPDTGEGDDYNNSVTYNIYGDVALRFIVCSVCIDNCILSDRYPWPWM